MKPIYQLTGREPTGHRQTEIYNLIFLYLAEKQRDVFTTAEIEVILKYCGIDIKRNNYFKIINKLKKNGIIKRVI